MDPSSKTTVFTGVLLICLVAGLVRVLRRGTSARTHSREYTAYLQDLGWFEKRRRCLALTHGRCALFPWLFANNAHHLHYRNLTRETVIWDIVPLSAIAHDWVVHRWIFWKGPLRIPINWYLRASMVVIALAVRPKLALVIVATLIAIVYVKFHS